MKIGYLHRDTLSLNRGESVQSWQISSRLSKKNTLFGTDYSGFSFIHKIYHGKKTLFHFYKKIDVLFTIVDGYVDFYHEKFTPLARIFGVPNIWLLNSPIEETFSFKHTWFSFQVSRIFRLFTAKFVDHAICISEEMEEYAQKVLGIKSTSVLPNGADEKKFHSGVKKQKLLSKNNTYKVIWSGNGEFTWQALDVVFDLARYFEKKDKNILFIIISKDLWIKKPKLDNLLFLDSVDIELLPSYLNMADLCLCLYHDQKGVGFYRSPMKLFDYMSMKKPIIGSRLGQIQSVIRDGKNGILVDTDIKEIAKKILFLKNNPQYAHKIATRARKDIESYYTWDIIVSKISAILTQYF